VDVIKQADGDLLVSRGACDAARRIHPGDPDYDRYAAEAVDESALAARPGENEALAHSWFGTERRTA
jgi:hypothetical protein